ncbi:MAG: hypothetical protein V8S57_08285 [Oscillospiraceae bacterium]
MNVGHLTYTAPSIGAGENQKIRASFPTTADYHGCDAAEGTLTVDKANVRVKVQAAAISAGETLTTQQYVTTNPEDTFTIFKVYSGVTSGLSGIVYVQLPESMVSETALKVLDPIVKPILGKTLTEALQRRHDRRRTACIPEGQSKTAGWRGRFSEAHRRGYHCVHEAGRHSQQPAQRV